MSAGLAVAAIVGVQLGRSTISEINPIHFQGALERPQGVDPSALQPAPDSYALAYGWEQGYAARAVDCGGDCDARQARDTIALGFAAPVAARDLSVPYWRDVTPTTELAPWAPGAVPNRGLSVERYMHYPVAEPEAAAPSQAAEPIPATAPSPTPDAAAQEPLVEE